MSTARTERQRHVVPARRAMAPAILVLGFLVAGCGGESVEAAGGSALASDANPGGIEHAPATEAQPLGTMTSSTPKGVSVHLTVDPDRPLAGPVDLRVHVDHQAIDPSGITVDLVAPRMPAHGIRRFPTHLNDRGEIEGKIRIPMEGLWMVYVNLDRGSEAAPFEFEVLPGVDDHGHDHDTDSESSSGHDHHMNSNRSHETHQHS